VIDLYVGINETKWNHHPTAPGPLACIAPAYGSTERTKCENSVCVPYDCAIFQDSGAFSDGPTQRLSLDAALRRQYEHAEKYGYTDQVTGLASYDLLIDEKWTDGIRRKCRWSEGEAEAAVSETVKAARFLAQHRNGIPLILSAQGVTPRQYLGCVERVIQYMRDDDILGLGGWCIIGKMPKIMMPVFRDTIRLVVPFVAREGVKRVHIWGVVYAPALGWLLWLCDRYGIKLSTDSSGPSRRPAFGEWGYADWHTNIKPPPVEIRGLERARHVRLVREWLANFRWTQYYRCPPESMGYQMELPL
jgi:hypothetical protein